MPSGGPLRRRRSAGPPLSHDLAGRRHDGKARRAGDGPLSTVGLIVNPLAGRDVRRLVANASTSTDRAKIDTVRRVAIAATDAGIDRLLFAPDHRGLATAGTSGLAAACRIEPLRVVPSGARSDTTEAARAFRDHGVEVVVALGGDGTQRDVALGWPQAPLLPISTGTNNAFPLLVDPTTAGTAAGLVAAAAVAIEEVSLAAKLIHVSIRSATTVALVDAVLVAGRFTGSRAVWQADSLRSLVVALADPAALGISALAGRLHRALATDAGGVFAECHPDATRTVTAPIVPGSASQVGVREARRLAFDESVEICGPGVLALDGERDTVLGAADVARLVIRRDGPQVIDPWKAVRLAAARGLF